jgi:hypothetical protein
MSSRVSPDHHDLDQLTGIRSGKPSFYVEYLASAERLRRVIHALDRISRALVRTTEGPRRPGRTPPSAR